MRQRTEVVLPLAPDELEQAIVSPARRAGLAAGAGAGRPIVQRCGRAAGRAAAAPVRADRAVRAARGPHADADAPTTRAAACWARWPAAPRSSITGLTQPEQEAARQLFLRLVTLGEGVEDTRRRVRRSRAGGIDEGRTTKTNDGYRHRTMALILALRPASFVSYGRGDRPYGQARLLTFDRDPATRAPTVEVAHEALLRDWARLRQWLDASRAALRMQRQLGRGGREWAQRGQDAELPGSRGAAGAVRGLGRERRHLALNTAGAGVPRRQPGRARSPGSVTSRSARRVSWRRRRRWPKSSSAAPTEQTRAAMRLRRRASSHWRAGAGADRSGSAAGIFARATQAEFVHAETLRLAAEGQRPVHGRRWRTGRPAGDSCLRLAYSPREIPRCRRRSRSASASYLHRPLSTVWFSAVFSPDGQVWAERQQ